MTTILTTNLPEAVSAGGLILMGSTVTAARDVLKSMLLKHSDEISLPGAKLDPDWDMYEQIERAGGYKLFIAKDAQTGAVAGYIGYFVSRSLHYESSVRAVQDVLYLEEEYRTGWNAANLIKYSEHHLKQLGVDTVYQSVTTRKNFAVVLKRIGYTEDETMYVKQLGVK